MAADGERYVVAGLNRLTVPVVEGLCERRPEADVVVVAMAHDRVYGPMLRRPRVTVHYAEGGLDEALRGTPVDLPGVRCLIALEDSDLENLRAAVIGHTVAPHVPIVLRVFDRVLSDQLEQLDSTSSASSLNVRRAYSMSALSAPAFIAAALGQTGSHLLTMHLAEGEIPFLALTVREGSPMLGAAIGDIEHRFGCAVIARQVPGAAWGPAPADEAIVEEHDTLLIAGPEGNVFLLASRNEPLVLEKPATPSAGGRWWMRRRRNRADEPSDGGARRTAKNITLLPRVALCLAMLTMVSMAVVIVWGHKRAVDGFYWTITAAVSGSPADKTPGWLKVFAVVPILSGGALGGVMFSYLASVATAQRLDQRMERRARRMKGHIVLGGLGAVGYRVERLLWQVGVPTVVIELSPTPRFAGGVQDHAPVLQGDVRLSANLERAGVRSAACLIAVTDDDLVNLEACLTARSLNPGIRTIARIFDEALAERGRDAFGIDECFSAVRAATPAFVAAATDRVALRGFEVGGTRYSAFRYVATGPVALDDVRGWRAQGIRIVAFRHGDNSLRPPSALVRRLEAGDSAIVAGPQGPVETLAASSRPYVSR